jgi:23S rRNA (guanosine2251-2'-O)-methyltransferase
MAGPELERLEGRNPVLEALRAGKRVRALWIDGAARSEAKLNEILHNAQRRGLEVQRIDRKQLDLLCKGGVHNGVVAAARQLPQLSVSRVLERADKHGRDALMVMLDEVHYEQNLGAVLRTSEAAGVDAVVVPVRRAARMSPAVARVAMGAAEYVPIVREGLSSALASVRRAGLRVVGLEADATSSLYELDLTGPLALVFGGEDKGLTDTLRKRCDAVARLPMRGRINSLNLSVAVGAVLYERLRQLER